MTRDPADVFDTIECTVALDEAGRITIPAYVREKLGLEPGDELPARVIDILPAVNGEDSRPQVGILWFAGRDLLLRGESAPTPVEQANRRLCQPAGIPISPNTGEIREYVVSDILRAVAVRVGDEPTRTDVQAAFDPLTVLGTTTC